MNSPALAQARKKSGRSQTDVAKELGVSQAYVSMVERGERSLPRRRSAKAVRVYGLSPTSLPVQARAEGPSVVDPDVASKISGCLL